MIVAIDVDDESVVEEDVDSWRTTSSCRIGDEDVMCPYNRPSTSPDEDENRWIIDVNVGPEIAIFCNGGRSSFVVLVSEEKVEEEEAGNLGKI